MIAVRLVATDQEAVVDPIRMTDTGGALRAIVVAGAVANRTVAANEIGHAPLGFLYAVVGIRAGRANSLTLGLAATAVPVAARGEHEE